MMALRLKMKEDSFVMETDFRELPISPDGVRGFRPYQLMIAAIAGCIANVFKQILNKMRLEVENIRITANHKRDDKNAGRIKAIHLHFTLKGNHLPEEKVKRALALARKNCSMIQTVQACVHVTESFEIV